MSDEVSLREFLESKLNVHTDALIRIENQVKKTNGRVTALERWRWVLTGAFVMLSGLVFYASTIGRFIEKFLN